METDRGRPLHVINVYGNDKAHAAAAKENGELTQEISEVIATLGAAWWIAGGDWNEEAVDIWDLAVAEGRGRTLPRHDHQGATVRPSGRRIDWFLVSDAIASRCGIEEILTHEPLYPHHPVRLALRASGRAAPMQLLDTPSGFPGSD